MMRTETFRSVLFSDRDLFDIEDDKVSLKRYKDALIFYSSFDAAKTAVVCSGPSTPVETGTNELENFGEFSQHINVAGSIQYSYESFATLGNEGSIKFRMRTGFNIGTSYQISVGDMGTIATADYYCDLYINEEFIKTCVVPLTAGNTISHVLAGLTTDFDQTVAKAINATNKLKIYTDTPGAVVEIRTTTSIPAQGLNLITLFGGMNKVVMPNGPTVNNNIFEFTNGTNNENKIVCTHTTTSNIILTMYDKEGALITQKDFGVLSLKFEDFYALEFSWNISSVYFFVNGKLTGVEQIENNRDDVETYLKFNGTVTCPYKIDEVIVEDVCNNFKNYTVATEPLTPYATTRPYVDIEFGSGFDEEEVSGLDVDCASNIHFSVKIGNTWYYYFTGDWRTSDGSFAKTNEAAAFEANFASLYFNKDANITIRAYFDSDGYTESWLNEVSIILQEAGDQPATITGTIDLTSPVDLSTNNEITITTASGSYVVDCSSAAASNTAVTIDEIKQAIDDAVVPGLEPAHDDGYGHLVLISTATGMDAYLSVSEGPNADCLDIVWGFETTETGTEEDATATISYTPLFDYVRTMLGAPIVPVELTDGQLEACLNEAVVEFNKWRNFDQNIHYMTLPDEGRDGYEIPTIIGGRNNIIDVIVRPRSSFGLIPGVAQDDIFAQALLQKYGRDISSGFLADYAMFLSFEQDAGLILGTTPRWEILNGRLFLTPFNRNTNLQVGIKYKAPLSMNELLNSNQIRKYVLARAKIILGTIRSTFGSSIPGGGENIQLNGESLLAQGKEELDAALASMKGESEPLLIMFG